MTNPRRIFVISSPSGAGKTTLARRLIDEVPGLEQSISVTTRPPRPDETNGKDYFFITQDEFNQRRENGEFLEWAKVFDGSYATPEEGVEGILASGKDAILIIDVQGARQIKEKCPDTAVTIFVMPPSEEELARRLAGRRTETEASIKKRLEIARKEIAEKENYDHLIINDSFENALRELKKVILKYRGENK